VLKGRLGRRRRGVRRGGVAAVEVGLPLRVDVADGHDDPDLLPRRRRLAAQLHAGLGRQPILLARVARFARGDHVLPCVRPAARARDDMIDVLCGCGAVLALERVANEDGTPREARARTIWDTDEVFETDDRWDGEGEAFGVIRPAVLMDKLSLVLEDEDQRPPRAHHAERLECCVEDEGSSHVTVLPTLPAWLGEV